MLAATLWGGFAAFSLLIGYWLTRRKLSNRNIGIIMGFGAGALISAIAYELVPESIMTSREIPLALAAGAFAFFIGDWMVDHRGGANRMDIAGDQPGGSGAAIFIGTLLDNVPESIVLGMSVLQGGSVSVAFMAAVFASNLPEGVAGTINLETAGRPRRRIFWMWVVLVIISALCAGLGFFAMQWLPSTTGQYAQAFAAGAMLTMLADAMMPEAFEHGGLTVGLFTVLGFVMSSYLSVMY